MSGWRWRPLAIVLLSVGVFCLTAQWLGLVLASLMLVFFSSVADEEFSWKEALLSGVIQAVSAVAVFVYGLGVPFPVWPAFIPGGH